MIPRALLAACAIVALAACTKPPTDDAPAPLPSAMPADHLKDGELAEGKEKAFALILPSTLHVVARLPARVEANGPSAPEQVSNFIRARVRDGRVTVGASTTRFDGVRVPAEPDRYLTIRVQKEELSGKSRVIVEDTTPPGPVFSPTTSPEDRMKSAGMTPQGKLLDPKHME